jgi:hypothetical protein
VRVGGRGLRSARLLPLDVGPAPPRASRRRSATTARRSPSTISRCSAGWSSCP